MKHLITILSALLLVSLPICASDAFPPFSWDRTEELDFLAKHFDFITIENDQASGKHGNTEAGFTVAAREIKTRNPRAKVPVLLERLFGHRQD